MFTRFMIRAIKVYQIFSSMFPPRCRFIPSCSHYTVEALQKYGATKGLWLGVNRVLRCHPFNKGGYDPVP